MAEIRPDVVSELARAIDERTTDAERAALLGELLARLNGTGKEAASAVTEGPAESSDQAPATHAAETRAALEAMLAKLMADVDKADAVVQVSAPQSVADPQEPTAQPPDPAAKGEAVNGEDLPVPLSAAPPASAAQASVPATTADRSVPVDPNWLMNLHADLAATRHRNIRTVRALTAGGAILALGAVALAFSLAPGVLGSSNLAHTTHQSAAAPAPGTAAPATEPEPVPADSPFLDPHSAERRELDQVIGAAPQPKPAKRPQAKPAKPQPPKPKPAKATPAPKRAPVAKRPPNRQAGHHAVSHPVRPHKQPEGYNSTVDRVLDQIR